MSKVLILFAHPALEKSRINKRIIRDVWKLKNITFNDLYERYPDFFIDVPFEQKLLTENDIIIFQHPFFWYSTPPLLKQWEDLVLEHGWAYGSEGNALAGKKFLNIITTGGSEEAYQRESFNRFTVNEFLVPIEQTARLCGMDYLPPYLIQGAHKMSEEEIERTAESYIMFLDVLANDKLTIRNVRRFSSMNEALTKL